MFLADVLDAEVPEDIARAARASTTAVLVATPVGDGRARSSTPSWSPACKRACGRTCACAGRCSAPQELVRAVLGHRLGLDRRARAGAATTSCGCSRSPSSRARSRARARGGRQRRRGGRACSSRCSATGVEPADSIPRAPPLTLRGMTGRLRRTLTDPAATAADARGGGVDPRRARRSRVSRAPIRRTGTGSRRSSTDAARCSTGRAGARLARRASRRIEESALDWFLETVARQRLRHRGQRRHDRALGDGDDDRSADRTASGRRSRSAGGSWSSSRRGSRSDSGASRGASSQALADYLADFATPASALVAAEGRFELTRSATARSCAARSTASRSRRRRGRDRRPQDRDARSQAGRREASAARRLPARLRRGALDESCSSIGDHRAGGAKLLFVKRGHRRQAVPRGASGGASTPRRSRRSATASGRGGASSRRPSFDGVGRRRAASSTRTTPSCGCTGSRRCPVTERDVARAAPERRSRSPRGSSSIRRPSSRPPSSRRRSSARARRSPAPAAARPRRWPTACSGCSPTGIVRAVRDPRASPSRARRPGSSRSRDPRPHRPARREAGLIADDYDPLDAPEIATYNSFANALFRDNATVIGREADGACSARRRPGSSPAPIVTTQRRPPAARAGPARSTPLTEAVLASEPRASPRTSPTPSEVRALAARFAAIADLPLGAQGRATPASPTSSRNVGAARPAPRPRRRVRRGEASTRLRRVLRPGGARARDRCARSRASPRSSATGTASCCSTSTRTPRSCRPGCSSELFARASRDGGRRPEPVDLRLARREREQPRAFADAVRSRRPAFALSTSWRNGTPHPGCREPRSSSRSPSASADVRSSGSSRDRTRRATRSTSSFRRDREGGGGDRSRAGSPTRLAEPAGPGAPPTAALLMRARKNQPVVPRRAARARRPLPRARRRRPARRARGRRPGERAVRSCTAPTPAWSCCACSRARAGASGSQDLHELGDLSSLLASAASTSAAAARRGARDACATRSPRASAGRSSTPSTSSPRAEARPQRVGARSASSASSACATPAQVFARLRLAAGPRPARLRRRRRARAAARHRGRRPTRSARSARRRSRRSSTRSRGYLASTTSRRLGGFLAWLREAEKREDLSPRPEDPEPGTVQVLTIHGAKGLEWDVVAVPRLVDDELPAGTQGARGWMRSASCRGSSAATPPTCPRCHGARLQTSSHASRRRGRGGRTGRRRPSSGRPRRTALRASIRSVERGPRPRSRTELERRPLRQRSARGRTPHSTGRCSRVGSMRRRLAPSTGRRPRPLGRRERRRPPQERMGTGPAQRFPRSVCRARRATCSSEVCRP